MHNYNIISFNHIIYDQIIILKYYILLLPFMIIKNSALFLLPWLQYRINLKIKFLLNQLNIKFILLLIIIIIKNQLKIDLFYSINASILKGSSSSSPSLSSNDYYYNYYHYRPTKKDLIQSYLDKPKNWLLQKTNNPFLSNLITNKDHINPYNNNNNNNENDRTQQFNHNQYINKQTLSIIEKFKKKLLIQLNLKTVPNININNESEWNSLPIILRNRLKNEIDITNQLINKPIKQDEEKETLILLKQYQPPVKLPNPNIFILKVAEEIDPTHISRVTLHVEINGEIRPNSIFTCWEIYPTLFKPKFLWLNDDNDDDADDEDNDPTAETFSQIDINNFDEIENDPNIQSTNLFNYPYKLTMNRMFKLIKPEIDKTILPENYLTSMVTFNITNRMINWLKYNRNNQPYKPFIRYIMIICNNCDHEQQNIIDPKKVVMEIKYRPRLKRQRRSLTKGDETIYNVCRSNGHHYSCCTQPLSVKFSDIGWDNWIIHPKSFEPNYCRGSCKVTSTKSLHYDVMDLLLRKNLSQFGNVQRDEVQSCCHPTQLTSMSVLYLDSNRELQMHTLHNLIVLGCACS
ncbi:unnamed protein product [Schistosoma rodhaini]|nr:unnamed protein product [Schistosoma rodhaini]